MSHLCLCNVMVSVRALPKQIAGDLADMEVHALGETYRKKGKEKESAWPFD